MSRFLLGIILFICQALVNVESYVIIYGDNNYTKYEVGTFPIILSAGHGGLIKPKDLSLRTNGCLSGSKCVYRYDCTPKTVRCKVTTVTDGYTADITEAVAKNLRKMGIFPHVIFMYIKRTYIDVNRPIDQACGGRANCEKYYKEYHGFIEEARKSIKGVVGIYFDIHGQKHSANWTELGYRVSKTYINTGYYENITSSINLLKEKTGFTLKELFTGNQSFGAMLSDLQVKTVPSPIYPSPGSEGYYRGGYSTLTYGSSKKDGNCTDGIQIELPRVLRFGGDAVREKLAEDLAKSIKSFVTRYRYGSPTWKCVRASDADIHKEFGVLMFLGIAFHAFRNFVYWVI